MKEETKRPSFLQFHLSAAFAVSLPFALLVVLHLFMGRPPAGLGAPDSWRFIHLILLNTFVLGVLTFAFKMHAPRTGLLWFWLVVDLAMIFGAAHVLIDLFGNSDPFAWRNWYDLIFVLEVAFDLVDLLDVLFVKVRRGQLRFFSREVLVFCLCHHTFAIMGSIVACQLRILPRVMAFFTFNILSHVFVVIGQLIRLAVTNSGKKGKATLVLWRIYRVFQVVANIFLRIVLTAWASYDLLHCQLEAVILRFGFGRSFTVSIRALVIVFLLYNVNLITTYIHILVRDWNRGIVDEGIAKKKSS